MFRLFLKKSPKKIRKIKKQSLLDQLIFFPEKFCFSKAVDVALLSQGIFLQNLSYEAIKKIELKSSINFSSKYSDIKCVEGIKDGNVEISTNLHGIAGIEGSLPDVYTENFVLYNRNSKKEIIDFLDIFNGRFLAMRYLFLKKYDISCSSESLEDSAIGKMLFSLAGFDSFRKSGLSKSLVPEQIKVSCQNFFWKYSRSSEGLRAILSGFCKFPVSIKQFSGKFVDVGKDSQTALGQSLGQYNVLGKDSFLGHKVWDQMDGIDIFVGPLDFESYLKYLPRKSALDQKLSPLEKFKNIIREYVPFGTSVNIHFKLSQCFIKELRLLGTNALNKDAFTFGNHNLNNTEFIERL